MMELAAMEVAQLLGLRTPAPAPPPGKESYRVEWMDPATRSLRVERFAAEWQARRRFHELLLKGGATAGRLSLTERGRSGWETRSRVVPKTRTSTQPARAGDAAPLTGAQRELQLRSLRKGRPAVGKGDSPGERDAYFRRLALKGPR